MAKLSEKNTEAFLEILRDGGSVTTACQAIGVKRQSIYQRRANDPDFKEAWDDAVESGTDRLEDEAVKRARNSSDLLLIFMLKARRPHLYRERIEQRVQVDSTHRFDLSGLPVRRLEDLRDILIEAKAVAALPAPDKA